MNDTCYISDLLQAWNEGNKNVLNTLIPLVEKELRQIAHNYMRRERVNHTLQTTALINEAYLKLINQRQPDFQNRAHFFALSANIMRHILLNYARDRIAEKRGGGAKHLNIEDVEGLTVEKSVELLALDAALEKLSRLDVTKSRIIELRYFAGLTLEETAQVLGLATITVSVKWKLARLWLQNEILGDSLEF